MVIGRPTVVDALDQEKPAEGRDCGWHGPRGRRLGLGLREKEGAEPGSGSRMRGGVRQPGQSEHRRRHVIRRTVHTNPVKYRTVVAGELLLGRQGDPGRDYQLYVGGFPEGEDGGGALPELDASNNSRRAAS